MSDLSWMAEAACQGMGPEVFFSSKPALTAEAKATCSACPVLEACRDYAASTRQPCGVWGGIEWPDATKCCSRCHEVKPRSAFGSDRSRADGLTSWCRECRSERKRAAVRARKASQGLREEVVALAVQLGPHSAERIAGIVGRHPNTVRAILRYERRRTYAEQAS